MDVRIGLFQGFIILIILTILPKLSVATNREFHLQTTKIERPSQKPFSSGKADRPVTCVYKCTVLEGCQTAVFIKSTAICLFYSEGAEMKNNDHSMILMAVVNWHKVPPRRTAAALGLSAPSPKVHTISSLRQTTTVSNASTKQIRVNHVSKPPPIAKVNPERKRSALMPTTVSDSTIKSSKLDSEKSSSSPIPKIHTITPLGRTTTLSNASTKQIKVNHVSTTSSKVDAERKPSATIPKLHTFSPPRPTTTVSKASIKPTQLNPMTTPTPKSIIMSVHKKKITWTSADNACRESNRTLVVLNTPERQQAAEKIAKKSDINVLVIGLRCKAFHWVHSNGESLNYSNWGEEANYLFGMFAAMSREEDYKWIKLLSSADGYICQSDQSQT